MESTPLVSVIVPNYNHAVYLPKRLSFIIQQTFQDFELIILDDGSTDNSREVIRQFADQHDKVSVCFNKQNSGSPFKQWNKGVGLAKGEYIWIAESDDYADTRFLEKLLPRLEQNPSIGVAYCQSWVVDEHDTVIGDMQYWTKTLDQERWAKDYVNNGPDECRDYLCHKPTIPNASAVLFRKDIYLKTGMADESFVMCGDWMHWIKMLLLSDVCFVAEPLNYFRQHQATTRHILTHEKVLTKIREEYQILAYLLSHMSLSSALRSKLKKDYFNRSIEFCPVRLKFSGKIIDFVKIVKEVDLLVYFRLIRFILHRLVTYGPEKIKEKLY